MAKARFGGDEIGPNPTDRAKPGTKRSLLVESDGGPLAVVIAGANVHDTKLLEKTLSAVIVERPNPKEIEQHLCLDKGYDNPNTVRLSFAGKNFRRVEPRNFAVLQELSVCRLSYPNRIATHGTQLVADGSSKGTTPTETARALPPFKRRYLRIRQ